MTQKGISFGDRALYTQGSKCAPQPSVRRGALCTSARSGLLTVTLTPSPFLPCSLLVVPLPSPPCVLTLTCAIAETVAIFFHFCNPA